MLVSKDKIKFELENKMGFGPRDYDIVEDKLVKNIVKFVNVHESVDLSMRSLEHLPFQFGKVTGNFDASHNKLIDLLGAPWEVTGDCFFNNNKIHTLEHAPSEVGGTFSCSDNWLTTLENGPYKIGRDYYVAENRLVSLKGLGKVSGDFVAYDNDNLGSIGGFGELKNVEGDIELNGVPSGKYLTEIILESNYDIKVITKNRKYIAMAMNFLPSFVFKGVNVVLKRHKMKVIVP